MVHTKALLDVSPPREGTSRHVRFPGELSDSVSTLDFQNDRLKMFSVDAAAMDSENGEALLESFDGDTPFSKLVVYSTSDDKSWEKLGFHSEGRIRGYFRSGDDAFLWVRYSDEERALEEKSKEFDDIVALAQDKDEDAPSLADGLRTRLATEVDAERLSNLLNHTFEEYPKDISPEEIRRMILSQRTVYRVAMDKEGGIVACATIEIDLGNRTGEVSECATYEPYQGKGLMGYLIRELEEDVKSRYGITDLYSTARAQEVGMNMVLAKLGYEYTGRQVNNCRMPDGWESMNVWCKSTA
jgi:putative beta-lysine N-acetyltransferase